MKFVKNGPDIPEELIDAHQRGEVVFFCGAGISMNNGYPSFTSLYNDLCKYFNFNESEFIQDPKSKEYIPLEIKINTLANNVQGGLTKVKKKVESDFCAKGNHKDLKTQQAILKLSCNKDNCLHLITTNFDSLFSDAAKKIKSELPKLSEYYPPFLPLSYEKVWNGIVYLHGNFKHSKQISNYDSIILSSSDFGKAYLTQGWATNFMKYVFSRYKVCFIGYSLNDQIFTYLMDSLSTDEADESTKAWIITGECKSHLINTKWLTKINNKWHSQKVFPIYYEVKRVYSKGKKREDHSRLLKTISRCSNIVSNRQKYIKKTLQKIDNLVYNDSNNFVDELKSICWVLLNASSECLSIFKSLNHQKSLSFFLYLQKLCKALKVRIEQDRESITYEYTPQYYKQYSVSINVINNISPYLRQRIVNELSIENWFSVDNIKSSEKNEIYKTLTNYYILDEELLFLFLERHICLSNKDKCSLLASLSTQNQAQSANEISSRKHKSLLSFELLKDLWCMYIKDDVDVYTHDQSQYDLLYKIDCLLGADANYILSEYFRPVLFISSKYNRIEIRLLFSKVASVYDFNLQDSYKILPCVTNLLFTMIRLDAIAERISNSYSRLFDIKSISKHDQNKYNLDNVHSKLIYYARDCWLDLNSRDKNAAKVYLELWFAQESPYLKRLALYGATVCNKVTPQTILQWLLSDSLMGLDNQNRSKVKVCENVILTREVCQLLKLRGNEFSDNELEQLVSAIFSIKEKRQSKNFRKALLLSRLKKAGANLKQTKYRKRISSLLDKNQIFINDDDRYDFPVYFSSNLQEVNQFSIKPNIDKSDELLKQSLLNNRNNLVILSEIFSKNTVEFSNTLKKLYDSILRNFDVTLASVLFKNFQYLNKDIFNSLLVEHIDLLNFAISKKLVDLEYCLPEFIELTIKDGFFESNSNLFIDLIQRFIDVCRNNIPPINLNQSNLFEVIDYEVVSSKVGYLVIKLSEFLFDDIYDKNFNFSPKSKTKIFNIIERIFLSSDEGLLAGRLACIYKYNSFKYQYENFEKKFKELFDINNSSISSYEHTAAWYLFVMFYKNKLDPENPKYYEYCLDLSNEFLVSSNAFSAYSSVLAYIILNRRNLVSEKLKDIIHTIDTNSKCDILSELADQLSGIKYVKEFERATNNLKLFFDKCWIKSKLNESDLSLISTTLCNLIIETDNSFPKFYQSLNIWLSSLTLIDFDNVVQKLNNKELVSSFPSDVLDFIYKIKTDENCDFRQIRGFSSLIKKLDMNINTRNQKLVFFKNKLLLA